MIGFNGGLVGKTNTTTSGLSIPGVWTLWEQARAKADFAWAGSDPYFTNVSLLLKGDGTNGSTIFTDSSANNFSLTRYGDTIISTAQSKYGGSSIYFDGTGDYLSVANDAAFDIGTADFTIEAWAFIAGNSLSYVGARQGAICGATNTSGAGNGYEFYFNGSLSTTGTGLVFYMATNGSQESVTYSGTIAQSTWHHVAASRSSGVTRLFLNGSEVASKTFANQNFTNGTYPLHVGGVPYVNYEKRLNGYIDEFRFTKGVGRYTTNFTPPAEL